jgi:iron complex outermembrane recepter protein
VASGVLSGSSEPYFSLPGGGVGFAVGLEYRKERSKTDYDPLRRGAFPIDTPSGPKGTLVRDLGEEFEQVSLVFDPSVGVANQRGGFSVREAFAEVSLPLFKDRLWAHDLTLDGSVRFSEYSTLGSTFTWNYGLGWSPIPDLRLRAALSEATRVPNIGELFGPAQGVKLFPTDPCDGVDVTETGGSTVDQNCRQALQALGVTGQFIDQRNQSFTGIRSGNPLLQEETARTYTFGMVVQPRFLEGLSLSLDYFDIELEGAITSISSQNIVDSCYESSSIANQFCGLLGREQGTGHLNFVLQQELNFAALKTAGVEFATDYAFSWGDHDFRAKLGATWVGHLDRYFDPVDKSKKDPELGELDRPEWAGNARLIWEHGPLGLQWHTQYIGEQVISEIDQIGTRYGREVMMGDTFLHSLAFRYDLNERYQVYGSVNNLTNESVFITTVASPTTAIGRFFQLGLRGKF